MSTVESILSHGIVLSLALLLLLTPIGCVGEDEVGEVSDGSGELHAAIAASRWPVEWQQLIPAFATGEDYNGEETGGEEEEDEEVSRLKRRHGESSYVRFGKRAPREQAYVRFGKRSDADTERQQNAQLVRRSPESSYVRFGKRRGGASRFSTPNEARLEELRREHSAAATMRPCTIAYLSRLESVEERLAHLRTCFMPRATRGRQDSGYVRFGRRRRKRSAEDDNDGSEDTSSSRTSRNFSFSRRRSRCFLLTSNERTPVLRDCSGLSEEERSRGIVIMLPATASSSSPSTV